MSEKMMRRSMLIGICVLFALLACLFEIKKSEHGRKMECPNCKEVVILSKPETKVVSKIFLYYDTCKHWKKQGTDSVYYIQTKKYQICPNCGKKVNIIYEIGEEYEHYSDY